MKKGKSNKAAQKKAAQKQKRKKIIKKRLRALRETHKVIEAPKGMEKMSDVLQSYAEPLLDAANNYEQISNAIGIAAVVWNASLAPTEEEAKEKVQSFLEMDHTESSGLSFKDNDFAEIFTLMFDRKQRFFQNNRRMIVDYDVTDLGEGDIHINVASTMPDSV